MILTSVYVPLLMESSGLPSLRAKRIRKGAIAPGSPDPLLSGTFSDFKIRAVAEPAAGHVRRQVN